MAYTTALLVRKVLPTFLIATQDLGAITGNTITLQSPAYDVPSMYVAGNTLEEGTDYTFTRPRSIALVFAGTGQTYIATVYLSVSDSDLNLIIAEADRRIQGFFARTTLPGTDYLQDWSSRLSAAMYLRRFATATEENMTRADALEQTVIDDMQRYLDNIQTEDQPRRNYVYVRKVN